MDWVPYSSVGRVFVEITKADHGHGGAGWEFGTCLWSPTRNRAGADRYSIMRQPAAGDAVLHFYARAWPDGHYESRLAGRSKVAASAVETDDEPPSPGDWAGMAPFYRIELADYQGFPRPLPLRRLLDDYGDEVRGDIVATAPRFYPFNLYADGIRTVQGIYLAEATVGLYSLVGRALGIQEAQTGAQGPAGDPHAEYAEARRLARERYYFARNPLLVRAAKDHYGFVCQVCSFNFRARYGELGEGYIECHHLRPLSERAEEEQLDGTVTSLEDVTVVCANCHRMLHRRRPALTVEELRAVLVEPGVMSADTTVSTPAGA